jgi:hypothetical protein
MEGYLPHWIIKSLVFWVMTACLVATSAAGILLAWEGIAQDLANRLFWTAFILASGNGVFMIMNLVFGDLGRDVFGTQRHSPPIDPAFADRLKKAKEYREGESQTKAG